MGVRSKNISRCLQQRLEWQVKVYRNFINTEICLIRELKDLSWIKGYFLLHSSAYGHVKYPVDGNAQTSNWSITNKEISSVAIPNTILSRINTASKQHIHQLNNWYVENQLKIYECIIYFNVLKEMY